MLSIERMPAHIGRNFRPIFQRRKTAFDYAALAPARLVAPPLVCRNQARTGTAALAVGVAVNNAASWSASKARTRS